MSFLEHHKPSSPSIKGSKVILVPFAPATKTERKWLEFQFRELVTFPPTPFSGPFRGPSKARSIYSSSGIKRNMYFEEVARAGRSLREPLASHSRAPPLLCLPSRNKPYTFPLLSSLFFSFAFALAAILIAWKKHPKLFALSPSSNHSFPIIRKILVTPSAYVARPKLGRLFSSELESTRLSYIPFAFSKRALSSTMREPFLRGISATNSRTFEYIPFNFPRFREIQILSLLIHFPFKYIGSLAASRSNATFSHNLRYVPPSFHATWKSYSFLKFWEGSVQSMWKIRL